MVIIHASLMYPLSTSCVGLNGDGCGLWCCTSFLMKTDLIHSYCQVLGTGDDGSSPCLLVSVERTPRYSSADEPTENTILRRYIFNVGEGTQRFCGEHGVKLAKVDKLFLTGTGAEEHAGLSGLVLTLSGLGSPALEVFGPTGVEKLVGGLRYFAHRDYPVVTASALPLGKAESQCSYMLGDEYLEVRCGVLDPARLHASAGAELIESKSSSSSSGSEDESESNSSDDSSDDSSSDSSDDSSSDSSDDSNSTDDSDAVVVSFSKSSKPKCANTRRGGTSQSGGPSSRTLSEKIETVMKTALDQKRREKDFPPRVDVDLTGGSTTSHGAGLLDVMSKAEVGTGRPHGNQSSAQNSSSQNGKERNPMERHGNDSAILDRRREGIRTTGIGGARVEPEGIPTKGPVVLYRCRVLHGVGSSFLVLSCPNIAYVRAVLNHSIVRGARQADRVLFVIHFSPAEIVEHASYAALLSIKAKHILVASGRRGRELGAAGGLQHRKIAERSVQLNYVAPQAFPLHFALRGKDDIAESREADVEEVSPLIGRGCTLGQPLLKAVLLPVSARGIDLTAVHPPVDILAIREDMLERSKEAGLCDSRDRIIAKLARVHGLPTKDSDSSGTRCTPELPLGQPCGEGVSIAWASKRSQLNHATCQASPSKRSRQSICASSLPRTGVCTWPLPPPPPPPPPPPLLHHIPFPAAPLACGGLNFPLAPPRVPLFSGGGIRGAEIFFLGTGCAAPSKNRGCSGILLKIPQSGLFQDGREAADAGKPLRLLIDAGEGTLGHLERQFGREGALEEIQGLDCVWISHKHADHHAGLFRLLSEHHRAVAARKAFRATCGEPAEGGTGLLTVVAPSGVLKFLESCRQASGENIRYKTVNCHLLIRPKSWCGGGGGSTFKGGNNRFGVKALLDAMASVPVIHCQEAYGLVIQPWHRGEKIVYSGDTRPCERLVAAGAGAALLIHEATFDDSMQEDAISKKHSTTSEALAIGRRMRAGEVVLTHFSQRYPRVPVLEAGHDPDFSVAFDGMVLNGMTYAVLPAAASLLSQLLERTTEDEDGGSPEISALSGKNGDRPKELSGPANDNTCSNSEEMVLPAENTEDCCNPEEVALPTDDEDCDNPEEIALED